MEQHHLRSDAPCAAYERTTAEGVGGLELVVKWGRVQRVYHIFEDFGRDVRCRYLSDGVVASHAEERGETRKWDIMTR